MEYKNSLIWNVSSIPNEIFNTIGYIVLKMLRTTYANRKNQVFPIQERRFALRKNKKNMCERVIKNGYWN